MGGRVGGRRSEPKGSGVRGRLGCRPALPPTRAASFQNTSWRPTPFPSPAGFQKLRQLVLAPSWVQTLSEGGTRASKNSGLRFLEGQAQTGRQMLGVPARPQEVWPLPGWERLGPKATVQREEGQRVPELRLHRGPLALPSQAHPFPERPCLPTCLSGAPGGGRWVPGLGRVTSEEGGAMAAPRGFWT